MRKFGRNALAGWRLRSSSCKPAGILGRCYGTEPLPKWFIQPSMQIDARFTEERLIARLTSLFGGVTGTDSTLTYSERETA